MESAVVWAAGSEGASWEEALAEDKKNNSMSRQFVSKLFMSS